VVQSRLELPMKNAQQIMLDNDDDNNADFDGSISWPRRALLVSSFGRRHLRLVCLGLVLFVLIGRFDGLKGYFFDKSSTPDRPLATAAAVPAIIMDSSSSSSSSRFCEWKTSPALLWWLPRKQLVCHQCSGSLCHRLPLLREDCGQHPAHVEWDPRIESAVVVETASLSERHYWRLFSDGHSYESHPDCSIRTCWALDRCMTDGPMTLFVPPVLDSLVPLSLTDDMLEYAVQRNLIRVVHDDPDTACLVLLANGRPASYDNFTQLLGDGQNRLVWDASEIRFANMMDSPHVRLSGDDAFGSFHVGQAVVASVGLAAAHVRLDYDLALPLPRQWGAPFSAAAPRDDDYHNRTYTIAFRGQWTNRRRPYYLHRWLAYAYWEDRPDVYVDLQCVRYAWGGLSKTVTKPYNTNATTPILSYDEVLLNATFGFAPGGSGPGSFRFGEILAAGGIPVVVPDTALPFWPALDWSACVVTVSESDLVDLPRRLRSFTPNDIAQRRAACRATMLVAFGDALEPTTRRYVSDPKQIFATAMQIMWTRIQQAKLMMLIAP
jgi:hypothetical protein